MVKETGLQVLAQQFENVDVEIASIDGDPYFELYSTGMALGQVKTNNIGMQYPRKERIDENVKNADIVPCVHNGHKYLSENQLYDLMLEMKTDKVKPFRKWLTQEVIPSIRKYGGYVEEISKFIASYFPQADEFTRTFIAQSLEENKRQQEIIKKQSEQIEEQRPAVEFTESICKSSDNIKMRDMAKLLCDENINIGEKRLYNLLRDKKVLMQDKSPYQSFVDRGYFYVSENSYTTVYGTTGISSTTLVTPKGQIWLVGKVREWTKIA